MDDEIPNRNLIYKLPTILRDFAVEQPGYDNVKELTAMLNTSITGLNLKKMRTEINRTVGFIANSMNPVFIPLSSYTVERLATEMDELVLYKKAVPTLPYNKQLENQNNLFFARLLPKPFPTELAHYMQHDASSPLLRYMAHCIYALCRGVSPEHNAYNINDPVLHASGCNILTLKEYTLHILNNLKHIGHKLYQEPTEKHCETIIKQFHNNKTVLKATRDVNEIFNTYWQQAHTIAPQDAALDRARTILLEAHKHVHERIINPDLTRNIQFKTKDDIMKFFGEQLEKDWRMHQNIIAHPPKFDELPPITTYDGDSFAVMPPSWLGRPYKNDADILELFPPIVACEFFLMNHLKQFLSGTPIEKDIIMDNTKVLCSANLGLSLSPQTQYALEQTMLNILHGRIVNVKDSRLTYNKETEFSNRHTLVHKLPSILKDLTLRAQVVGWVDKVITPLFKPTKTANTIQEALLFIGAFIRDHNRHGTSWYFKTISPQTAAFIAQEYCNLINHDTPVSEYPYIQERETANLAALIQDFPQELNAKTTDAHKKATWNIAFYAYWLKNPEWKKVLIEESFFMEKHLQTMYEENRSVRLNSEAFDALKDRFITTFGPLTYCHDLSKERIRSSLDDALRKTLAATLDTNCAIMRAAQSDADLKKMNFDALMDQLKENLPNCPVCFELFSDQFHHTEGGVHTEILPCKHIFCSKCIFDHAITQCPLCRGEITSTVPPKPSFTAHNIYLANRSDGGY